MSYTHCVENFCVKNLGVLMEPDTLHTVAWDMPDPLYYAFPFSDFFHFS